jgi:hypothetical protein
MGRCMVTFGYNHLGTITRMACHTQVGNVADQSKGLMMTIKVIECGWFSAQASWGYMGWVTDEMWFFDCSEATARAIARVAKVPFSEM